MSTDEAKTHIARALGQIPSGASIVTARHNDTATGMLTSWVQQAGFEPPALTVAIRRGRPIEPLIEASGHFVVNLIGEERTAMFKHFSKGFDPGEPAFTGLAVQEHPEGIALEACIASLRCRVIGKTDTGDHRIYVGEIVAATASAGAKPYVHLRSNGLRY